MFAIDCLKANGTHLGTCIDRFYFGSCCLIEPVHDILDNTIESDIIPHREPPLRVSNTTIKPSTTLQTIIDKIYLPTSTSSKDDNNINGNTSNRITSNVSSTTASSTSTSYIISSTSTSNQSIIQTTTTKPSSIGDRATEATPISTPSFQSTTIAQKLQTFQAVNGVGIVETTTKAAITTLHSTASPTITTNPVTSNAHKPITPSYASTKPTIRTTTPPKTGKPSSAVSKPQRTTKVPLKVTQKPNKTPVKPIKVPVRTTTKKPQATTTAKLATVSKITKKPGEASKPTKKITSIKSTTTTERSPETLATGSTYSVTQSSVSTTTGSTTSTTSVGTTSEQPDASKTTSAIPILATTVSNVEQVNKVNVSQVVENTTKTVVESKPPVPANATLKPTVAVWAVIDEKNHTIPTVATDLSGNVTTEDWTPITTPDGWVLLPTVHSNQSQEVTSVQTTTSIVSTETSATTLAPSTIFQLWTLPSSSGTLWMNESTTTSTASSSSTSHFGNASVSITEVPMKTESSFVSSNTPMETTTSEKETSTTEATEKPINMTDFTDVCGRRMYPEARIVGGDKAAFGEWPWQISLRQWRTSTYLHKCGAALLNENWAITAAHCVDTVPPSDLLLRLGEHDLSTEEEPYIHQERRVQIVASHPQFDPRTFEYDLALLRFYEPVTFQPNIIPVCVPQSDESFVGKTAFVTGWGRLYEDGPLPSIVQKVSVPVINNTLCEQMYRSAGYIEHIPHIFICAGWRRGGFDSCEGDSGGPMVIQRSDRRFLLAGVISWGIGCAEPNQPGVYTRISEFRDWINQILQF